MEWKRRERTMGFNVGAEEDIASAFRNILGVETRVTLHPGVRHDPHRPKKMSQLLVCDLVKGLYYVHGRVRDVSSWG